MQATRRQVIAGALAATLMPASALAQARRVSIALDWTPNTNHVGLHVAQVRGFYEAAGVAVDILPYTETAAGTLVAGGVADFGIVSALALLTQHAAGADIVGAYALVQTETGRIVFNADRADIQRPRDLDGKTYGGFGSAWENALIGAIIRNDGGRGNFETVTLGTSAYEALAGGAVDFTLEVYTWEGVKAELDGRGQRAFRYADFGVPDQHSNFIASSRAYLSANPDLAKAFLRATRDGYAYAVAHPDEAADILVRANPDALTDPALVRASMRALVEGHYLRSAAGETGTIDPAKTEAMVGFLTSKGILKDRDGVPLAAVPDIAGYVTNSFLDD